MKSKNENIESGVISYTHPETKTCTHCGKLKPVSEFYKNKRTHDGLTTQCKECILTYQTDYLKRKKKEKAQKEPERKVKIKTLIKDKLKRKQYKVCARCLKKLPVEKFTTNSTSKDGLQSYCQECGREYAKRYQRLVRKYNVKTLAEVEKKSPKARKEVLAFYRHTRALGIRRFFRKLKLRIRISIKFTE